MGMQSELDLDMKKVFKTTEYTDFLTNCDEKFTASASTKMVTLNPQINDYEPDIVYNDWSKFTNYNIYGLDPDTMKNLNDYSYCSKANDELTMHSSDMEANHMYFQLSFRYCRSNC